MSPITSRRAPAGAAGYAEINRLVAALTRQLALWPAHRRLVATLGAGLVAVLVASAVALAIWRLGGTPGRRQTAGKATSSSTSPAGVAHRDPRKPRRRAAAPRKPTAARGVSVYAFDGRGMLSPAVRTDPARIYVPNSESNTVDVVDPASGRIVSRIATGALPQHVTPSYDLKTLYVLDDQGNSIIPLDPRTGRPKRKPIPVADPYNLYFTPDGRSAVVVAERERRLDFRDPRSFRLQQGLPVPCTGVDHLDFSADGRFALASCEFSSELVRVGLGRRRRVTGTLLLDRGRASPQDVKLSPDGRIFYVADKAANGLWLIDARRFRVRGFLHTGAGAHGLYVSRDGRFLYVTNRGEGSVSVVSFASNRVVRTWRIPGGGSPDMGGVSADGRVLWLSGRWNGVLYALSTRSGRVLARIPVGASPHGVAVWPQPGRFSLGHTGILR